MQKIKATSIPYEVWIINYTWYIGWVNGPFSCGEYPDLKIFKNNLKHHLSQIEEVLKYKRYIDERCVHIIEESSPKVSAELRARHGCINGRIMAFGVINDCFRHHIEEHGMWFHAISVLFKNK